MSLRACLFTVTCLAALDAAAQPTIWNGPDLMFSKGAFADPTLPENQDRVTDDVWLTRAAVRGLYNAASESSHDIAVSPAGTEWAYGTTDDLGTLTFSPFADVIGLSGPFGGIGNWDFSAAPLDFVVHLTSDDVYFDLTMTDWGQGSAAGGSFAYTRSTPIPEPGTLALAAIGLPLAAWRRRRR